MNKKLLSLLLVLALSFGLLTGCQNKNEVAKTDNNTKVETTTEESTGTHKVVDHAGHEVELPNNIERIVIDQVPIMSTYMAYHKGEAPHIVGYAGSLKAAVSKSILKDIAPELLDAETTVEGQSDLNVEEIIKLKPDVIFYNAKNADRYEALSKTGIPLIGFATVGGETPADPINRNNEWLRLLEDVFNEKGKMDDYVKAGEEIVSEVEERIAKVPEDKRPTSMILWKYNQGVPIVAGTGSFGGFWQQRIGTKNVAAEEKGYPQVNAEQIYSWNPEVLFLDGPGLLDITTDDVYNNSVEGIDFSNLDAVKNKRVFNTRLGMWNWFTPNPDAPLVYAWMAKSTYPEEFKEYDLNAKIKEYYSKWYNYDLSEDELKEMFNI
ncbi:ABC transporter substrate-binding protein [Peptoniphilus ovalis]|nr:ABC transporter substrate-binding protein [Peptoniphilus ovalis]